MINVLNQNRKNWYIIGLALTLISFSLLYTGIRVILGNELVARNLVAFAVFSLIVGGVASVLTYFRWKIAFIVYLAGMVIGYIEMYRAFSNGISGWGDLVGLMSLLVWLIIGLIAGVVLEMAYKLYKKIRDR